MKVSPSFELFAKEAPKQQQAWMTAVKSMGDASALDAKTQHLAYLAVLAAEGLQSGIPFHVKLAKESGASREEVISALLVGLPAVGHRVIAALVPAISAYDESE